VDSHKELDFCVLSVVSDRTVFISGVVALAPGPIIGLEAALLRPIVKCLSVHRISGRDLSENEACVVIGNVLLACASGCVVVLGNSNNVHHLCFRLLSDLSELRTLNDLLVKRIDSEELVGGHQGMLGSSDVFFVISSRSVKPCPVRHVIVSVREHIVVLGRPCELLSVHGIHVH
jgi:hypothetical protein